MLKAMDPHGGEAAEKLLVYKKNAWAESVVYEV